MLLHKILLVPGCPESPPDIHSSVPGLVLQWGTNRGHCMECESDSLLTKPRHTPHPVKGYIMVMVVWVDARRKSRAGFSVL